MARLQSAKVKGCKSCGRAKRKAAGAGRPLSLYIRGKITAEQYFKLTNQKYR